MEKKFLIKQILAYYDGPVLFIGQDLIETHYICQLIDRDPAVDEYLCLPISKSRLGEFYAGNIDLRHIINEPETRDFYVLSFNSEVIEGETSPVDFKIVETVDESWLPDEGFYLKSKEVTKIEERRLIGDAASKNTAVVCFSLNPPESRQETKISTPHLIKALQLLQGIIRESYRQSIKDLSKKTRKLLNVVDNFQLDTYAFAEGSFKVYFQSKANADMFGHVEIERAMTILDEITTNIDDEQLFIKTIHKHKGHLASYYVKLIEYIIANDSPINYSWTMPAMDTVKNFSISKQQAIALNERLNIIKEMGIVRKTIVGRVIKADSKNGRWTIFSVEENKNYSGHLIEEDTDASLRGIVIEEQIYSFNCEERIEEDSKTGREKVSYFLTSYEEYKDSK